MATPVTPGRAQSTAAASNVRMTSPEPINSPDGKCSAQAVESASVSSNTVLGSPHGVTTGTALNSFPDSEYCGSLRESPPE